MQQRSYTHQLRPNIHPGHIPLVLSLFHLRREHAEQADDHLTKPGFVRNPHFALAEKT
jgi:hypothetical protein